MHAWAVLAVLLAWTGVAFATPTDGNGTTVGGTDGQNEGSLDHGSIVGICVGVAAGVALVAIAVFLTTRAYRAHRGVVVPFEFALQADYVAPMYMNCSWVFDERSDTNSSVPPSDTQKELPETQETQETVLPDDAKPPLQSECHEQDPAPEEVSAAPPTLPAHMDGINTMASRVTTDSWANNPEFWTFPEVPMGGPPQDEDELYLSVLGSSVLCSASVEECDDQQFDQTGLYLVY